MKIQQFITTVSHAPHDADVIIETPSGETFPVSQCEVIDGELVIKGGAEAAKETGVAKFKKAKGKKAPDDLDL